MKPTPLAILRCTADDGSQRLVAAAEAGGSPALEAEVMKPVDLRDTHGPLAIVEPQDMEEMIANYDPALLEGTLDFDHAWGGPSHGIVTRLWMVGDRMWARWERLSAQAVEAIESGQWPRRSAEWIPRGIEHRQLPTPYFLGASLLGKTAPAMVGLAPARLVAGLDTQVLDLDAAPGDDVEALAREVEQFRAEIEQERAAANELRASLQAQGLAGSGQAFARHAERFRESMVAVAGRARPESRAQLLGEMVAARRELQAERAEMARLSAAVARERAVHGVMKAIEPLRARLPKAFFADGTFVDALVALKASGATVRMVRDGAWAQVDMADAILENLRRLPFHPVQGRRAEPAGEQELSYRNDIERRAGITRDRAAELQAKYPGAFIDDPEEEAG